MSEIWSPSTSSRFPPRACASSSFSSCSFAERLIGSIRRECLNHVLVLGERHLRRTLARYFAYYHRARTQLSLDKDAPHGRRIERPKLGRVIPIREVGWPPPSLRPTGRLLQPSRFATFSPALPSGCSPPHPQ